MNIPWNLLGSVPKAVAAIGKWFKGVDKKTLTASVVIAGLTFGALDLALSRGLISSPREVDLGGLDLGGYCRSYHYGDNDEDSCLSAIDLGKACTWEHGTPSFARVPGTYSAQCYASAPPRQYEGGVEKLPQYCRFLFPNSAAVRAVPIAGKWTCRTDINKAVACGWQYQKPDLRARRDDGLWHCYAREES